MAQPDRETLEAVHPTDPTMGSSSIRRTDSAYERGHVGGRVKAAHGVLRQLIRPARGFQTMKTAYAAMKGFEIMRMIRHGHCICSELEVAGETRFINKLRIPMMSPSHSGSMSPTVPI